jgi:acetoin utilization deacetylase AcuC-like enzyme
MGNRIKVFYRDEQNCENNDSFSPSAGKPKKVVETWLTQKLHIQIETFKPLTREILSLAHDRRYVDGVLDLQLENGFGNRSAEVADSLLFTNGSMLSAAVEAVVGNTPVVVSPTSGFHHASYGSGGAFCTFNGLMITAAYLRHHQLVHRVGILDLDAHYGDGTEDIIQVLGIDYIHHYSYGADLDDAWLNRLPQIVKGFHACDLILYQAGADVHVNDPLGGNLTSAEIRQRDKIVFATARQMGKPVVWNFAGGYQTPIEKVIQIHTDTLQECLSVYGV